MKKIILILPILIALISCENKKNEVNKETISQNKTLNTDLMSTYLSDESYNLFDKSIIIPLENLKNINIQIDGFVDLEYGQVTRLKVDNLGGSQNDFNNCHFYNYTLKHTYMRRVFQKRFKDYFDITIDSKSFSLHELNKKEFTPHEYENSSRKVLKIKLKDKFLNTIDIGVKKHAVCKSHRMRKRFLTSIQKIVPEFYVDLNINIKSEHYDI